MPPYKYPQQMISNAWQPDSLISATNTAMSAFFQRYLWQDLIGVLKWTIPKTWDYDYFTYCIYSYGYVAIINTNRFGIIPQQCTVYGYNVFYQPTHALINNPIFDRSYDLQIGSQCSIIRINADWLGMWDLITYYADLMATMCDAIGVNVTNSKLAYVFFASGKSQAETFKQLYQKISRGEPAVVADKDSVNFDGTPNWTLFDANVAQHYISDKLLVDLTKVRQMFREEIGIPNSNTEKRERMIVDEVNANNAATAIAPTTRLERLKRGCEETNRLFNQQLVSVDWLIDPMEANNDGGNTRPNDNSEAKS